MPVCRSGRSTEASGRSPNIRPGCACRAAGAPTCPQPMNRWYKDHDKRQWRPVVCSWQLSLMGTGGVDLAVTLRAPRTGRGCAGQGPKAQTGQDFHWRQDRDETCGRPQRTRDGSGLDCSRLCAIIAALGGADKHPAGRLAGLPSLPGTLAFTINCLPGTVSR